VSRVNPYYTTRHWRELRKARLAMDRYQCVVEGCNQRAVVVDHVITRPPVPYPCEHDTIENTRSLCRSHDCQAKEQRTGSTNSRRNDGTFRVKGCDLDGWPLDPKHGWGGRR
jgi:hypothetical protein